MREASGQEKAVAETGLLRRAGRGIKAAWLRLAARLARVNTIILLTLLYFLVIAPINLIARVARADLLGRRIGDEPSFWLDPEYLSTDLTGGRRQF